MGGESRRGMERREREGETEKEGRGIEWSPTFHTKVIPLVVVKYMTSGYRCCCVGNA